MWDDITYSFPHFSGCTVEVWEWISYFIPHFTYNGCNDLSMLVFKLTRVSKGARGSFQNIISFHKYFACPLTTAPTKSLLMCYIELAKTVVDGFDITPPIYWQNNNYFLGLAMSYRIIHRIIEAKYEGNFVWKTFCCNLVPPVNAVGVKHISAHI